MSILRFMAALLILDLVIIGDTDLVMVIWVMLMDMATLIMAAWDMVFLFMLDLASATHIMEVMDMLIILTPVIMDLHIITVIETITTVIIIATRITTHAEMITDLRLLTTEVINKRITEEQNALTVVTTLG